VLSWGSRPPELSPPRFRVRSLASTRAGGEPRSTRISGRPAIAVAFRDPDSDAWAREPRIRRSAESIELRGPPSGSGPAHRAPLECSRAPVASTVAHPAGRVETVRLARAPSRRHPAPPCPWRPTSREGRRTLDLEDAHVEPSTRSRPSRGALATEPLAELGLVTRRRVDRSQTDFRQPSRWTRPFAGSRSVVGPPVTRGADSHGISSLVEPARTCERSGSAGLFAVRNQTLASLETLRALRPGGGAPSPGHRF
jgi:hypothetical protein